MSKRMTKISLKAYRAFYDASTISLPHGENALIYGENGSGKSSLYAGLSDCFNVSPDIPLHHHLHATEQDAQIVVDFTTDQGAIETVAFPLSLAQSPSFLKQTHKLHSFLSYKELLKTYLIDPAQFEEQFFELMMTVILQDHQNPISKNSLSADWQALQSSSKRGEERKKALADFNNGVSEIFREVNTHLQGILHYFPHHLQARLVAPTLRIVGKNFPGQAVRLDVDYFQYSEIDHLHILNEARLSALAISIYLASILSNPADCEYKILFLDDIFIGLDMSNRLPLLRILQEKFADFQIFLTTYDRAWFEVMREYFKGDRWKVIEMYAQDAEIAGKQFEAPLIVDASKDYIEKAEAYFKLKDYPACANYLRKALERQIKRILPISFKTTQSNDFGTNDLTHLETLINNLEQFFEDCDEPLPQDVQEGIRLYKMLVLNPMSHDDPKSPIYKVEIEKTFMVIKKLGNLPQITKTLLLPVHSLISYTNPSHDYTAEIELANNLSIVINGANKHFTQCKYWLKKWKFEGVEWSNMNRNNNQPLPTKEINKMCERQRTLEEIYRGICRSLGISENSLVYEEFQVGSHGSLQDLLNSVA